MTTSKFHAVGYLNQTFNLAALVLDIFVSNLDRNQIRCAVGRGQRERERERERGPGRKRRVSRPIRVNDLFIAETPKRVVHRRDTAR